MIWEILFENDTRAVPTPVPFSARVIRFRLGHYRIRFSNEISKETKQFLKVR
jgi:hypothetical protein